MKKMMSVIMVLVIIAVCSMTTGETVYAANPPSVTIPVEISLSGTDTGNGDDFVVNLEADDVSYPMPQGAENGICSLTITGGGSRDFPAITYEKAGIYTYTICQAARKDAKYTCDDTVYTLTVYVTNAEDGSGLEAAAVLYPDAEESKRSGAEFENKYNKEPKPASQPPATPETGDVSNIHLYILLAAISAAAIAGLFLARKGKHSQG